MFLRNATGLIREVSLLDAFIMNTFGMNIAVGAVFLFLQAPVFFPQGNMLLAVIIGTLVMAFTLLWVYATFAAAMPRSGGDYVFVSRVIHPFFGWLLGWSQGMWLIFFWIGFNAWFALTFAVPVALSTIGAATGQSGWIALSNNLLSSFPILGITTQWWVLVFGLLINIGFAVLLILGGQSFWRWQKGFFLFAGGSIILAFVLLLSFPFSLFRIVIAQELMGQQEREDEEALTEEDDEDTDDIGAPIEDDEDEEEVQEETDGMPHAWRGKGFAVIAAWSGVIGLLCYIVGTLASTLYLSTISNGIVFNATLSSGNVLLISIFAILTNTVGVGLLALSTLFFGAIIARSGSKLWPIAWVIFGYIALGVAALFSGSAVSVASAPASGQAPLTAPAILLFGVWVLWLGVMLVRLKPEPVQTQ